MTTIQSVLERFDNGAGFPADPNDGSIADSEIEQGGGYGALAAALRALPDDDARRVVGMLEDDNARQRLLGALAPRIVAAGMTGKGAVRADNIYGRRGEYARLRAELPPNVAALVRESDVSRAYLQAPGAVDPAAVRSVALRRASQDALYLVIAAQASRTPEERAEVFQLAMRTQGDAGRPRARFAAALTASNEEERAMVLAMAPPKNQMNADGVYHWQGAEVLAAHGPRMRAGLFEQAMNAFARSQNAELRGSHLGVAALAAESVEERRRVTIEGLLLADNKSAPSTARGLARRVALEHGPEEWRDAAIAQADADFRSSPASSYLSARRTVVLYGNPELRADILAGATMRLATPDGPRLDQMVLLGDAVATRRVPY